MCDQIQKISIPTPWKGGRGRKRGRKRGRGSQKLKFLKKSVKLNWNFPGEGVQTKNLPWVGMEIFWNNTIA